MSITINGQLLILMLIEKLYLAGFKIIMANTDGAEVIVPKEKEDLYYEICKDWEKLTNYELEYFDYSKLFIRDVNNYIAQYTNNKIKRKGCFEIYEDFENMKSWNKNPSMLIIPLALQEYFIHKKDYVHFIKNHNNIFDFCAAVKKKSNFEFIWLENNEIKKSGKVTRYAVTKDGTYLIKKYHDGRESKIESGWRVTVLNKIKPCNLNFKYYIEQTQKIIFEIEGNINQTTLW